MRAALGVVVLAMLAGCGARTGLGDLDAGADGAPREDGGLDTFPCRWSVGRPIELDRDRGEMCTASGAIHGLRAEALLVWQQLSCDVAPSEATPAAVVTLADPPVLLVRGELPDAFGALSGIEEGYLRVSEGRGVALYSNRLELIADGMGPGLEDIYAFDRLRADRVVVRRDTLSIVTWTFHGTRFVGPPFMAGRETYLAQ